MNRKQIEAWLALEGFVCLKADSDNAAPWLQKVGVCHVACYGQHPHVYDVGRYFEAPPGVHPYPISQVSDAYFDAMVACLRAEGML